MRYQIIYKSDYSPYDYVSLGIVATLQEARDARQCGGDLVLDLQTGKLVTDKEWLWDWEKEQPSCYAQTQIRLQENNDFDLGPQHPNSEETRRRFAAQRKHW